VSDQLQKPASDIVSVALEEEMRRSYLDYAMSVIVSRALPDVRDGLKPVHRRILYAMKESGNNWEKSYRKSASAVGYVMMKYHPHGDAPIYEAIVRLAQDFSMRLPLIDGQGNFGSMDGDPAAAARYTEARLAKVTRFLLEDIDKDTVDFRPNYDDTTSEPIVLPARFPNLLVNGSGGIAVGMATNIPPHNLGEVIDACCAYIDDPEISIEDLISIVPGPDFPTGGIILGRAGSQAAARTGRGSVVMRGRVHIEDIRKDRPAIVITEVPYQVNKARMIERMAEVVKEKIIEGIADLRDESDRDGVRVVVELKRDAVPEVVLNQLYRFTPLQTSFGVNALALDKGQPKMMSLRDIISAFISFREEVISRRLRFELKKARARAHVLLGLAIAVANIDEMIALIKAAPDPQTARSRMMERKWPIGDVGPLIELVADPGHSIIEGKYYHLSEEQARAILDLRLHRLTGLEREKISDELNTLIGEIKEYLAILASRERLLALMKAELIEVKEAFATPRRSTFEEADSEIDDEDLIQCEDMVVTVSQKGYIKRVPLSTYRAQRRGGKGRAGMSTRDEDFVSDLFVADTHTPVIFFSSKGLAYQLKVYKLPIGSPQSLGKAMINILRLDADEKISTILPLPKDEAEWENKTIVFVTSKGNVRRNLLSDFRNIKANGKIAMKLEEEGEWLVGVMLCDGDDDILLTTRDGKCIRFEANDVRIFAGRTSTGVRGIRLAQGDEVISVCILKHADFSIEERNAYLKLSRQRRGLEDDAAIEENSSTIALSPERYAEMEAQEQFILSVTNRGYGKRSSAYEYRVTGRGGQGIANMDLTAKNGKVVGSFIIEPKDQLMLVTDGGQLIRIPTQDIRIAGRKTQGVTLFRVAADEQVVSVARIGETDDEDTSTDEMNGEAMDIVEAMDLTEL
jgi:DNA gyrase subunit A